MRRLALLWLALWLGGCAALPSSEPRQQFLAAPPAKTLQAAVSELMARGYVIRRADSQRGDLEAVLARWPGYTVRLRVREEKAGSRLSATAVRAGRPLPATTLAPLLTALQSRLARVH